MKGLKQEQVNIIKINKLSVENLRSKIKQLIWKGDHSLYLTHLLLKAHSWSPIAVVNWLKQICGDCNLSRQQEARYFWILANHQSKNFEIGERLKYKTFISVGDWCL